MRFASRREAKLAMDRLQRKARRGPGANAKLNVYGCRFCGGWHVGTKVKR